MPESATARSYEEVIAEAARTLVAPHAARIDREDRYPDDVFRALANQISMAPSVPTEYGGGGRDLPEAARAMAALSEASPSVALSYGAHAFLCAHNLWLLGNEFQKRRYLPDLGSWKTMGAFAITEPGAGSDATSITTRAVKRGQDWVLSGVKTFITNGALADVVLLFARGEAGLSLFIVEKKFPGFGVGKKLVKLGIRGSPTSELILEDCIVPGDNLIGAEGEGGRLMMRCLDVERTLLSAMGAGMLESLRLVLLESAGDAPSQTHQGLLAEVTAALYILRTLGDDAAHRLQRGERVTVPASAIKLYGADTVVRLADSIVTLLGLPAARSGSTAERVLRDAKLMTIGAGTSEIQKLILAREALKTR